MTDPPTTTPDARAAGVGGVVGPAVLIGLSYLMVQATSAGEAPALVVGLAALFFGLMAFDLAVATGFARSRKRGRSIGNYSSTVAFSVILLPVWLMSASSVSGSGWTMSPWSIVAFGLPSIVGQVAVVRFLNGVGQASAR